MSSKTKNWKERAEEYLRSYVDPESDLLHEEAIVYFLSRGENCDEAVDKKFELWKARKEEHGWLIPQTRDTNYIASMWRLIEWGKIGQLSEFWDPTKHTYWLKDGFVLRAFKDRNYFAPLFLFRSDIAINGININLSVVLFNLQEIYKNGIGDYNYSEAFQKSPDWFVLPSEQIECMIAASYIFGQFRLKTPIVDPNAMLSATKLLLDNQDSDGKWYDAGEDLKGWEVLITASVVHALALAKPNGVERVLKRSYKWLLEQQNSDGSWSNVEMLSPVCSTVFVLDALELANGGSQVTFKMQDSPRIDSKSSNSVSPINIGTTNVPDNRQSARDLSINTGQGNITIKADGPVYLQSSEGENEAIRLKSLSIEDIKESIGLAEQELLKDGINLAIFLEYQKYEMALQSNPNAKRPTYRLLADILDEKKLTKKKYSAEGIKGRVRKLIDAGLVTDYFAEMRRNYQERSEAPNFLQDSDDMNY